MLLIIASLNNTFNYTLHICRMKFFFIADEVITKITLFVYLEKTAIVMFDMKEMI